MLLTSLWGLAGFTAFVPLHALDLGLGGSGWVFGLYAAIVLIVRSAGARLPDRVGPQRTVRLALVGSVVGLALIATLQSLPGLVLGTAAFAVGQALAFPALMTMAMAAAPAGERACVVGTLTASVDLAFGLGASSLALVAAVAGHEAVFLTGAFIAGIGLVIARRRNNFPTRRLATLSTNPTPAR